VKTSYGVYSLQALFCISFDRNFSLAVIFYSWNAGLVLVYLTRLEVWCRGTPERACQHAKKIVGSANVTCCLHSVLMESQRPIQVIPKWTGFGSSDLFTIEGDIKILMCFGIMYCTNSYDLWRRPWIGLRVMAPYK